jgi:hypothetical protein
MPAGAVNSKGSWVADILKAGIDSGSWAHPSLGAYVERVLRAVQGGGLGQSILQVPDQ